MSKHTKHPQGKHIRKASKRLANRREAHDESKLKMSPMKARGVRRPGSLKK